MTLVRTYNSPEAFKQALEARLRQAGNINRGRQILVMERFYGRIAAVMGEAVVVKGGMVLERRLDRARTTKDLDLRLIGDPEALLERLQAAGRLQFGDFLTFTIEPDPSHATIDGDGMVYEGRRFRVIPYMALLATTGSFDADDLLAALAQTFTFRATHDVPGALPDPPASWAGPYNRMAREDRLPWATLDELVEAVRAFIDPVLARRAGRWQPETWTW